MKKLAIALVIICMGSMVFAATAKTAAREGGMKFGLGAVAGIRPAYWFNNMPVVLPTIKIATENFGFEFGLNFTTISAPNSVSNTHFDILAKGEYAFSSGQVSPHVGGIFIFDSDSNPVPTANGQSSSGFGIGGYYGAALNVSDKFDITADVIPLMFLSASSGGQSTTFLHLGLGMITAHYYF